eukprot:COSAG01_NODE_63_length_29632_cov_270.650662_7_plen_91_part_00
MQATLLRRQQQQQQRSRALAWLVAEFGFIHAAMNSLNSLNSAVHPIGPMRVPTVNAFLEFLPTVGLAMVVNLRRGYPDTVLAEKFFNALL